MEGTGDEEELLRDAEKLEQVGKTMLHMIGMEDAHDDGDEESSADSGDGFGGGDEDFTEYYDATTGTLFIGQHKFHSLALWCLPVDNSVRRQAITLVCHPYFNRVVLVVVLANSMLLVVQNPRETLENATSDSAELVDRFFLMFFTAEFSIKVVAMGFILHPKSYMRSGWNVFDALLIFVTLVSSFHLSLGTNAFLLLRVLRPLRCINRVDGMRQLVHALFGSLQIMKSVITLVALVMMLFACTGVVLWKDAFHTRCMQDGTPGLMCTSRPIVDSFGINCQYPGDVCTEKLAAKQMYRNFDNIFNAFNVVMQSVTLDSWAEVAYWTQDAWTPFAPIYWIMLTFSGSYFFMNLVLAVITDSFCKHYTMEHLEKKTKDVDKHEKLLRGSSRGSLERNNSTLMSFHQPRGSPLVAFEDRAQVAAQVPVVSHLVAPLERTTSIREKSFRSQSGCPPEMPSVDIMGSSKVSRLPWQQLTRRLSAASRTSMGNDAASPSPPRVMRRSSLAVATDSLDFQLMVHPATPKVVPIESPPPTPQAERMISTRAAMAPLTLDSGWDAPLLEGDTTPLAGPKSFYDRMGVFIRGDVFAKVMMVVLCLNLCFMSVEHQGMSSTTQSILEFSNVIFTIVFASEVCVQILFLRHEYFYDRYNLIDFTVAVLSIVELAVLSSNLFNIFRMIRIFRVLRIIKLSRTWDVLRAVLYTIQSSLGYMSNLGLLVALFMGLMSIFGRHLMAGRAKHMVWCDKILNETECDFESKCMWLSGNGNYTKGLDPYDGNHSCRQFKNFHNMDVIERVQFDSLGEAIVCVFIIVTKDQWGAIMHRFMEEVGPWVALYFWVIIFIGGYFLVNLFVSILLVNLGAEEEDEVEAAAPKAPPPERWVEVALPPDIATRSQMIFHQLENKAEQEMRHMNITKEQKANFIQLNDTFNGSEFNHFASLRDPTQTLAPITDSPPCSPRTRATKVEEKKKKVREGLEELKGHSFGYFHPTHWFRLAMAKIIYGMYFPFEDIVTWLVVSNCFVMVLNKKMVGEAVMPALYIIDVLYSLVFSCEVLARMVVHGVYQGKHSYLQRHNINLVDTIVVVVSTISTPFLFTRPEGASAVVAFIARVLLAVRPLRVLLRSKSVKVIILACWHTGKAIRHVLGVAALIYFIFGLAGVEFFRGLLMSCSDGSDRSLAECHGFWKAYPDSGILPPTGAPYRLMPREWVNNQHFSFDNLPWSMITLFEMSILNSWVYVMFRVVDTGQNFGDSPVKDSRTTACAFFMTWIFIGAIFLYNLFVGVVVDHFTRQTLTYNGSIFLTADQNEVVRIKRLLHHTTAMHVRAPPPRREAFIHWQFNTFCFNIVQSRWFRYVAITADFVNIAALASIHYNASPFFETMQSVANLVVTIFFTIEVLVQIGVAGFGSFWGFLWFRFDSFVVMVSWIEFFITLAVTGGKQNQAVNLLRLLRGARFAKYSEGVTRLLVTLQNCFPAFRNVCSLVFMVFYIFALVGVALFEDVRQVEDKFGYLNHHINFATFPRALFALYRVATTDTWREIQMAVELRPPYCNDEFAKGPLDCGVPWAAKIYFPLFVMAMIYVMLNLFVAIVLENFRDSVLLPEYLREKMEDIALFREAWSRFDPDAVQSIQADHFIPLLRQLPGRRARAILRNQVEDETNMALGLGGEPQSSILPSLLQLDIPITWPAQRILFCDAIDAVGEKVFHIRLVDSATAAKHMKLRNNVHLYQHRFTIAQHYACRVIQAVWRAARDGSLGNAMLHYDKDDVRLIVADGSPMRAQQERVGGVCVASPGGQHILVAPERSETKFLGAGRDLSAGVMLTHSVGRRKSKWDEILGPMLREARNANKQGVYGNSDEGEEEALRARKALRAQPTAKGTKPSGLSINTDPDSDIMASPHARPLSPTIYTFAKLLNYRMGDYKDPEPEPEAVPSESSSEEPPPTPPPQVFLGPYFPTLQEFAATPLGSEKRLPTIDMLVRFQRLRNAVMPAVEPAAPQEEEEPILVQSPPARKAPFRDTPSMDELLAARRMLPQSVGVHQIAASWARGITPESTAAKAQNERLRRTERLHAFYSNMMEDLRTSVTRDQPAPSAPTYMGHARARRVSMVAPGPRKIAKKTEILENTDEISIPFV